LASPESLKLAIPALLYVVQNNLLFVALSNLSVPLYQVTNQGKLLTTAVCSRLLLNKSISGMQYLSLLVLALGVAVVQLSSIEKWRPLIRMWNTQTVN
jgi:UDP-sugar transporter A1/2/3